MARYDLHTHSTESDGTQPPADVVRAAARAGLDGLALTDHDTASGWAEAAQAALEEGLTFVPGMEMSCMAADGTSVHLLAYLHDPEDPTLLRELTAARSARLTRAQEMAARLGEDYPLTWELVQEHAAEGATIGRPHLADALVTLGVVPDRSAAFATILTGRSKYYVPHHAPDPAVAVELIRGAGGVPVFAHPRATMRGRVVGVEVIESMIEAGLAGLEADHRDNPEPERAWLRELADRHGLIVTGSSDYHGAGKPNLIGEFTTGEDVLAEIERQGTGAAVVRG
ncbi:PHP domain-containing protein [Micrococcus sp. NPDC078436]|uniref:PHP domain-containing protein n=1 Tax=Micrococcus TaxID=1269 RepID=UPI0029BB14E4|nr:PHP domain-containing protein [Micrococcus sp. M4NT]MDX2342097.1 PHP domain-containing protein [Micrococcus sp. M4NT]